MCHSFNPLRTKHSDLDIVDIQQVELNSDWKPEVLCVGQSVPQPVTLEVKTSWKGTFACKTREAQLRKRRSETRMPSTPGQPVWAEQSSSHNAEALGMPR